MCQQNQRSYKGLEKVICCVPGTGRKNHLQDTTDGILPRREQLSLPPEPPQILPDSSSSPQARALAGTPTPGLSSPRSDLQCPHSCSRTRALRTASSTWRSSRGMADRVEPTTCRTSLGRAQLACSKNLATKTLVSA